MPSKMPRREFGRLNLSSPNEIYRPPALELFQVQEEEAKLHPARKHPNAFHDAACRLHHTQSFELKLWIHSLPVNADREKGSAGPPTNR